jgi:hypothetical protein
MEVEIKMSNEACVISIFPFATDENKPSLIPATFHIPACKDENDPVILEVPEAQTHEWLDITRGVRVYKIPAAEFARSICDDKRNAMFGSNVDRNAYPGIAWLPNSVDKTTLKIKHPDLLPRIQKEQLNWLKYLIFLADDDWTKYHQYKFINDLQRYACDRLGLKRDWNTVFEDTSVQCPACMSHVSSNAIVCKVCKFVLKKEEYKKLMFLEQKV